MANNSENQVNPPHKLAGREGDLVVQAKVSPARETEHEEQDLLAAYLGMARKRIGLLLAVTVASAIGGYLAASLERPVYQAHTSLEVQSINENLLNIQNVSPVAPSTGVFSEEYEIQTAVRAFKSRSVMEDALSRGDLRQRLLKVQVPGWVARLRHTIAHDSNPVVPPSEEQLLTVLYNATNIQAQTNTRVLDLTVDCADAKLASDLTNALTDSYIHLTVGRRREAVQSIGVWLTGQIKELKAKLDQSESELQSYAQKSDLLFTSGTDNVAEQRLKQMQDEVLRAEADRVVKQSRFDQAATAAADSLPEVLDSPTLKEYQVELTRLSQQIAELDSSFTAVYPKTVKLKAQLASLEQARNRERDTVIARLRNEFDVAERRERLLRTDFAKQASQLSSQSAKVAQFELLKQEVQTTRQMYELMGQRIREVGLASAMRASNVQVLDRATPPSLPHRPSRAMNAGIGMFSGFIIGLAGVIASGIRSPALPEPGQLANYLSVPELAVIPAGHPEASRGFFGFYKTPLTPRAADHEAGVEFASLGNRYPLMADSFRGAIVSIIGDRTGLAPRIIVISSSWPNEGKTTIASNLAIMLAQASRKVLLVDGDLRRPRIHSLFQVDNSAGFYDALVSGSTARIQTTRTLNLSILTSGSSANVDQLFTPGLPALFRRFRAEYDVIIVDTPPLLQLPDARIIAQAGDALILTVDVNVSSKEDVASVIATLKKDGIPFLGAILNNYAARKADRRYNYYTEQRL